MSFAESKSVAWKVIEEILGITIGSAFTGTPSASTVLHGDGTWKDQSTGSQPLDADLTAIAALGYSSTSFLTKTAANTWALDTSVYLTTASAASTYLTPASAASTYAPLSTTVAGTYTPTLTNGTNVAASTPRICQYLRVGNTVTVSGGFSCDPTTGSTTTVLSISLPVASNLANAYELAGIAANALPSPTEVGQIVGDATNNIATVTMNPASALNAAWVFSFTYQVI
jgi:hypothetical protein